MFQIFPFLPEIYCFRHYWRKGVIALSALCFTQQARWQDRTRVSLLSGRVQFLITLNKRQAFFFSSKQKSLSFIQRNQKLDTPRVQRYPRTVLPACLFSSEIRKSLNIEPLLLRIERSQLRWFGHVSRMPQERLPKQALHAKANGRRPVGRPRTRWTDYIEDLGWNRLGLRPSEMMEVMEDREVWRLNLELLPPQPSRKSGQ